jgi:hypothetical protein
MPTTEYTVQVIREAPYKLASFDGAKGSAWTELAEPGKYRLRLQNRSLEFVDERDVVVAGGEATRVTLRLSK